MNMNLNLSTRAKLLFKDAQYYLYIGFVFLSQKFRDFIDFAVQFAPNINTTEIIVFDLETTGLNPYHEKIIDYAFVNFNDKNQSIESLVNPETKFEKKITDITGIHPDQLIGKPTINQCLRPIYDFINFDTKKMLHKTLPTRYLVAHNCIGFDRTFLLKEFYSKVDIYPLVKQWKFIDTVPFAKRLLPKLNSHSLKALAEHYSIKPGTHRAMSDTETLCAVFDKLIEAYCAEKRISKSNVLENPQMIIDYYEFM
jgi:DNA polymerase III alpha subunit (gram-positive type)